MCCANVTVCCGIENAITCTCIMIVPLIVELMVCTIYQECMHSYHILFVHVQCSPLEP